MLALISGMCSRAPPPPTFLLLSCSCTSSFKGERCLFFSDHSRSLPELEQLVAISIGVAMFVVTLAAIACCVLRRR